MASNDPALKVKMAQKGKKMMKLNQWLMGVLVVGCFVLSAGVAKAELWEFTATIDAAQVVTGSMSEAFGDAQLAYDPVANQLDLMIQLTGIDLGDLTNYHLHLAPAGANGGVIAALPGDFVIDGGQITYEAFDVPLLDIHEPALLSGGTYLNFHTVAYPGGEVRGQVIVVPEPGAMGLMLAMGSLCLGRRVRGGRGGK